MDKCVICGRGIGEGELAVKPAFEFQEIVQRGEGAVHAAGGAVCSRHPAVWDVGAGRSREIWAGEAGARPAVAAPAEERVGESGRSILVHSLRVAGERFAEHETELRKLASGARGRTAEAYEGLAEQFASQARGAYGWATRLENAESIVVTDPAPAREGRA